MSSDVHAPAPHPSDCTPARIGVLRSLASGTAALLLIGCTHSATVKMQDGSTVEGKILDNDQGTLTLEESDGRLRRVDAKRVRDIDHPGDTARVVGGGLAVGGAVLALAMVTASPCKPAEWCLAKGFNNLFAAGVALVTIPPGLAVLFWGDWAHSDSKERAEPRPAVSITPAQSGLGAGVRAVF